ncbi:hypothetical protein EMIHUDRAFT_200139 [Emiliania huxleyi CCMP1516]|uniref:BspA family leucine-rich repeat surface protein n=2 Tax=Emiliania huxleyi TaxID=2903 RepID=A0A0D3KV12_EMIH1|nr:hypothetical protein EMIHUDRAFT_200139 [Emiliania huxleyi CCMP1516]EOD39597.1 hypothetical protein EMIHUDRAFT_200139 [Emiliania huxleyi CCMP1516]|eukprot:XP_005792026.1 hypothetical protein EMIHUDRAFT_200139 [Emiliania huxleyi CCMP1516]
MSDEAAAQATYGHISSWDVSRITDMKCLFSADPWCELYGGGGSTTGKDMGNPDIGDISSWDTPAVVDMSRMFRGASSFNKDISSWDTSTVRYMDHISTAPPLSTKDISSWNTSAVVFMSYMFQGASAFDKDLSSWDTSAVGDASSSLSDCNKALIHAGFDAQTSAWPYSWGSLPVCKPFCEDKTQAWDDKCTLGGCNGCAPSAEDQTQAWDDKCNWPPWV